MKKTILAVAIFIILGSYLMPLEKDSIRFEKGKSIALQGQSSKIYFYDEKQPNDILCKIELKMKSDQVGETVLQDETIEQIEKAVQEAVEKGHKREDLRFRWASKDDKILLDNLFPFKLAGEAEPSSTGDSGSDNVVAGPDGPYKSEEQAESGLLEHINTLAKASESKYTVVIFNEDLSFRRAEPLRNTVGDMIYVCVIYSAESSMANYSVEFSPCSLEPESPMLFIGDTASIGEIHGRPGIVKYFVQYFSPRRCYNSSLTIKIKTRSQQGSYNLMQYNRYRGTLQIGVLSTDQHMSEFGLQEKTGKKIIYDKGPSNTGPEYFASLVIYSLPRYIETLFSKEKHYSGRDIINESSFGDRLGVVFGVGLNNPAKRFVLGFSFEALYGVNVIGVFDFARLNELGDGLKIGDKFSGKEEEIPVHYHWERKFVFGISLDLRYITALFSRR